MRYAAEMSTVEFKLLWLVLLLIHTHSTQFTASVPTADSTEDDELVFAHVVCLFLHYVFKQGAMPNLLMHLRR